jgi:tetratricopeptide (TPR) repeat protein
MTAPGADGDVQRKAAEGIRQSRMENSGDAYDLDDDEPGGGISVDEGARLWSDGEAAYTAGKYDEAYQLFYGLYGSGIADAPTTQANVALAIGQSLRHLGRFTESESWFTEAMTAPGADGDVQTKAAEGIRQARLENSGDAYDLDDDQPGGGISVDEGSRLWTEGETAYNAGRYEDAYLAFYGLYGAGVTTRTHSQAGLALAIGHSLRRLGRFTEAESWFNEAMSAPGTTGDVEQKAAVGIRQARLENSAEPYNLDD